MQTQVHGEDIEGPAGPRAPVRPRPLWGSWARPRWKRPEPRAGASPRSAAPAGQAAWPRGPRSPADAPRVHGAGRVVTAVPALPALQPSQPRGPGEEPGGCREGTAPRGESRRCPGGRAGQHSLDGPEGAGSPAPPGCARTRTNRLPVVGFRRRGALQVPPGPRGRHGEKADGGGEPRRALRNERAGPHCPSVRVPDGATDHGRWRRRPRRVLELVLLFLSKKRLPGCCTFWAVCDPRAGFSQHREGLPEAQGVRTVTLLPQE